MGTRRRRHVEPHVAGTPGHGSRPLRTDNALVKAAEIVRRISAFRPRAEIGEVWRRYVEGMGFPDDFRQVLLDPERVYEFVQDTPRLTLARHAHACTHTTFSPNVVHGGVKTNVIPDEVVLEIDIRTLPGQTGEDVDAMLQEIIGDELSDSVRIELIHAAPPSQSPMDTPLWDSLSRVTQRLVPGSSLVPGLIVGGTDARFFREAGTVAYGFGLFSDRLSSERYSAMFHGHDEHIDVESLRLSTVLWEAVAEDLLGG